MNPIAVIPKSTTHWFWKAVEGGAREGAKEAGAEMIWKGSLKEDDPEQQVQIVEQFVSEGVGGIVLAPIDDTALMRPVAAAMQKGIPVVIMDSALKGEPPKDFVCTVSTNNHRAGEMAGEQLGKLLDGKGKVVLFRYKEGSASHGSAGGGLPRSNQEISRPSGYSRQSLLRHDHQRSTFGRVEHAGQAQRGGRNFLFKRTEHFGHAACAQAE